MVSGSRERSVPDKSGTVAIVLRLLDHRLVVTKVESGSVAAESGVKPGWVLQAVNGIPVAAALDLIPAGIETRRASLLAFSVGSAALSGPVGEDGRTSLPRGG